MTPPFPELKSSSCVGPSASRLEGDSLVEVLDCHCNSQFADGRQSAPRFLLIPPVASTAMAETPEILVAIQHRGTRGPAHSSPSA
jgi:hypothetical protein